MSRITPTLDDRLVRYRPTLDNAIADRTALAASDHRVTDFDLIDLDSQPADAKRSSNRSRVLVGASAVVLIGGLAVIVATRDNPAEGGSGLTPACPPGTYTIGTGTLYLGGPASDQNLAAPGFIFSLRPDQQPSLSRSRPSSSRSSDSNAASTQHPHPIPAQ